MMTTGIIKLYRGWHYRVRVWFPVQWEIDVLNQGWHNLLSTFKKKKKMGLVVCIGGAVGKYMRMNRGQWGGNCSKHERWLLWTRLGTLREVVRFEIGYYELRCFHYIFSQETALLSRLVLLCLYDVGLSIFKSSEEDESGWLPNSSKE